MRSVIALILAFVCGALAVGTIFLWFVVFVAFLAAAPFVLRRYVPDAHRWLSALVGPCFVLGMVTTLLIVRVATGSPTVLPPEKLPTFAWLALASAVIGGGASYLWMRTPDSKVL